jgi:hypothetical protein
MNASWLARSRAAVWHPCTQMKVHETLPIVPIARGEGAYLIDFDGNRYLDAVSSWWVNLFGHSDARVKEAIGVQLDALPHAMLAGFTHRPVVELSERLHALTGLGHATIVGDRAVVSSYDTVAVVDQSGLGSTIKSNLPLDGLYPSTSTPGALTMISGAFAIAYGFDVQLP